MISIEISDDWFHRRNTPLALSHYRESNEIHFTKDSFSQEVIIGNFKNMYCSSNLQQAISWLIAPS